MIKNRYALMATAVMALVLLVGCQTAQKSGSTAATTAPKAKAESPTDTKVVKGIDGWEGEISGKPAPGSKFTKLKIGMGMKQVTDLIGQPSDQGAYVTGKAWIPFYFGSDRYRHELVYKGQGRLIFAGGSMGDYSSGHLISIIHNAQESGYR
jgi:hypothetical protein